MLKNVLKKKLPLQTGGSPEASCFTVTGKVVVGGDSGILLTIKHLLLCVQSPTTQAQKQTALM